MRQQPGNSFANMPGLLRSQYQALYHRFRQRCRWELAARHLHITDGRYYFALIASILKSIYMTLSLELHSLAITDILTPGVKTNCSLWPPGECKSGPAGATTLTIASVIHCCYPFRNGVLYGNCHSRSIYSGPINLPALESAIEMLVDRHLPTSEQSSCQCRRRKISGNVFFDANANGRQDAGETGIPTLS